MKRRAFIPAFLQRIDDKLLRNKPAAWAARTHLVVWFAALFSIVLTTCCYVAFYDSKQSYNTEGWLAIIGLIVFIGFVFWLFFLLRFNVFKRYGNWFAWDGLRQFVLYFISIGSMAAVFMIPSAVQTFQANRQFTSDEIINDVNEINLSVCKLEYTLLPLDWEIDTCQIVDEEKYAEVAETTEDINNDDLVGYINSYHHQYIDTASLRYRLEMADSTFKLNDSMYVFYTCPNYQFVNPSFAGIAIAFKKVLSSSDLYHLVIGKPQNEDRTALVNKVKILRTKYAAQNRYYDYDEADLKNANYPAVIKKKYRLNSVEEGIGNIIYKKYWWIINGIICGRVFFYTTFCLSLLVFVFRHTTVKTFFLTILTATVIVILTGLLIAIANGREKALLSFPLLYYVLFTIFAVTIPRCKVRKAVQGMALNLFFLITPFVPVIGLGLYIVIEDDKYYKNGYPADYINPQYYMPFAEIAGTIIFLFLLEPVFRKLYRTWYSAPEG